MFIAAALTCSTRHVRTFASPTRSATASDGAARAAEFPTSASSLRPERHDGRASRKKTKNPLIQLERILSENPPETTGRGVVARKLRWKPTKGGVTNHAMVMTPEAPP